MRKKICNAPGCSTLIEPAESYCARHQRERPAPFSNAIRYNEALYKTTRWRTLRASVLREQRCCSQCGVSGDETRLEVHHIIPPRGNEELFFDAENLTAVCPACHRAITNREIGSRSYRLM